MPGRIFAFFDTSAIIPLCVGEPHSQRARQAYRGALGQIVAWTTMIEGSGALYRALRLGALSQAGGKRALDRLGQLEKQWTEIIASERLREIALDVLRLHDLRAGDAIQLASAIAWCKEKPRGRLFICFDKKLSAAAQSIGFEVLGLV